MRLFRALTAAILLIVAIGLLAGGCAVMLPRVLALVSQGDESQIVFLPAPYLLLALGAGLFLGLVMLVFEWKVAATPRQTFMAALGIPAIVTGALGTASTSAGLSELAADAARLRQEVRHEQGIAKEGSFDGLQPLGLPAPKKPAAKTSSFLPAVIAIAHAEEARAVPASAGEPLRFGQSRQWQATTVGSAGATSVIRSASPSTTWSGSRSILRMRRAANPSPLRTSKAAAKAALPAWRDTPIKERAQVLFRLKALLEWAKTIGITFDIEAASRPRILARVAEQNRNEQLQGWGPRPDGEDQVRAFPTPAACLGDAVAGIVAMVDREAADHP